MEKSIKINEKDVRRFFEDNYPEVCDEPNPLTYMVRTYIAKRLAADYENVSIELKGRIFRVFEKMQIIFEIQKETATVR